MIRPDYVEALNNRGAFGGMLLNHDSKLFDVACYSDLAGGRRERTPPSVRWKVAPHAGALRR